MKLTIALIVGFPFIAYVAADTYANFFVDDACSDGGSIGYDIENRGCFWLPLQGSVYIPKIQDPFAFEHCLVISYDSDSCACQNDSLEFKKGDICYVLDGKAKSFRFKRGTCDENNCSESPTFPNLPHGGDSP